ncbi:MAG: DUF721 domain-containing protein [Pseudomonadota bacterium]
MTGTGRNRGAAGKRGPKRQSGGMAGAHRAKLAPKATAAEAKALPRAAPSGKKPFKPAGFRHAGTAAAPWLKEVSARRGFAEPRILTDWDDILGPALAPVCRPVKITYAGRGFGATLIVLASGARAPEVQMLLPRIIERVNGHYGYRAVSRIRVTQTDRRLDSRERDPGASASPENRLDRRDMTGPTNPHADAAAEAVQDPGLSAALERLGRSRAAHAARRSRSAPDAGPTKGRKA